MVKKILFSYSLIIPCVLISADPVPDLKHSRYSPTFFDDGIVQATQPETQTGDEEQNSAGSDSADDQVVPHRPEFDNQ